MTIHSPTANTDFPDPTQDDARFADLICNQIHSLVSQLHQRGKLGPERISNQLWDLAAAVKHIAEQYAVDHLSHSPSAAGHADDDEFFNRFPVSSNSPSSVNQEDFEPRTPLSDLFARPSPVCTADDNNRWLSEQLFGNFSLLNIPSYATDSSAIPSRDGTCKPSDLMPPPDLQDFRSSTDRSNPGNSFTSDQSAAKSPRRDGAEEGEEEEEGEKAAGRGGHNARSTHADCTHVSIEAEQKTPEPQSPAAVPVRASGLARDNARETPLDSMLDINQEARHNCESEGRNARSAIADGSEEAPKTDNLPTPPKQSKRKSADLETGDKAPKSRKRGPSGVPGKGQPAAKVGSKGRDKATNPQKAFDSFTDLTEISRKVLEPDEVHLILTQRCDKRYHNEVVFLTRLFFAIASPQAFRQLSEACSIVRQHRESAVSYSVDDDSGLMRALDVLDVGTTVRAILRRFYLVRLLDHRIQREDYYKVRRSTRVRAQCKQDYQSIEQLIKDPGDQLEKDESIQRRRPGRADTKAFADLLAMFYPNLKQPDKQSPSADDREYREKHLKLKNRLNCARNWYLLQQKLSLGILALVPCGEFQIGTDKFERIPGELFSVFLDVLYEYRGGFLQEVGHMISRNVQGVLHGESLSLKYRFENADTTSLFLEPMDSQRLISLCDTNSPPGPAPAP